MDRRALLGSGVALLAAGYLPARASAAATPDSDLAYARLLVAVELLTADFYENVIAANTFARGTTGDLKRAQADEQKHYELVAAILTNAGQTPATADDIDF